MTKNLAKIILTFIFLTAFAYAQEGETKPLYSFINSKGHRFYQTGSNLPSSISGGPWKSEGVVAHVMPTQASGTKPVFQLIMNNPFVTYAYTGDKNEANKWKNSSGQGQWMNQGPVFYVAAVQSPNTVPLYRLYAPLREVGDTSPGGFSGWAEDSGQHFYTTKGSERTHAVNNGWVNEGIVGYVWKEPFPSAMPDLTIQKTTADDSSVKVIYANKGKASASNPELKIVLSIYDKSGKQLFSTSKTAGGVSAGSVREVVIPSGSASLRNNRYKVKIDGGNVIKESDEDNNETAMLDGPKGIKINPINPGEKKLPQPSIRITGQKGLPGNRTGYQLAVSNWNAYPTEFFQSIDENVLPPSSCAAAQSKARMLAHLSVITGNAKPKRVGCKPLNSAQDLQKLELIVSGVLEDTDKVMVTVEDRFTKTKTDSYPLMEGWTGIGKLLQTVGCKNFLGREGNYLCTTDQGFKTCEDLRKQGKPIKCTRAGAK
jgi:hypothetical protein